MTFWEKFWPYAEAEGKILMPIQGDFLEFVTAALYSVGQTSNVCWTWE